MKAKMKKISADKFLDMISAPVGAELVDDFRISDALKKMALNPDDNKSTGDIRKAVKSGLVEKARAERRAWSIEIQNG